MKRDYIGEVIAEDAAQRNPQPIPRYLGCQIQQKEVDRKLHAALLAEFNDAAIADRVMRVVKEQRA